MKRKTIKIGIFILVLVTVAAAVLGTTVMNPQKALAAARLYGIQQIVDRMDDDYFTMLEIVPDHLYESLAFWTSAGDASVDERVFARGSSEAEREQSIKDCLAPVKDLGLVSYTDVYEERLYALAEDDYLPLTVSEDDEHTETRKGRFVLSSDVEGAIGNFIYSPMFTLSLRLESVTRGGAELDVSGGYVPQSGDFVKVVAEVSENREGTLNGSEFAITEKHGSAEIKTPFSVTEDVSFYTQEFEYTVDSEKYELSASYEGRYYSNTLTIAEGEFNDTEHLDEPASEDFFYAEEIGNYVFVDDPAGYDATINFTKVYMKIDFSVGDKFAESVLELNPGDDADLSKMSHIKIISMTPTELEEALRSEEINLNSGDVDFIYLSGTTALNLPQELLNNAASYSASNDVTWDTAYNIFEYVTNLFIPIVVDRNVLGDFNAAGGAAAVEMLKTGPNITRLAYLLRYYALTLDNFIVTGETTSTWDEGLASSVTYCGPSGAYAVDYGTYGAVTSNIYINGLTSGGSVLNVVRSNLDTLLKTYVDGTTSETEMEGIVRGLMGVMGEIETDNFYNNTNGSVYTSEYSIESDVVKIKVSGNTFLRYIINYANRRLLLYKDKVRVLDIEPTKYSTLTENKIKKWISGSVESATIKEYEIVQMSTYEFVGKIEDLIEEYDLIYIGGCIGNGTSAGSMSQSSSGLTSYNDSSMNGLIYTHVGDLVSNINAKYGGILNSEIKTGNAGLNSVTTRYSGNDITKAKYSELVEYVLAGYPVVIGSTFYNNTTGKISTGRVDASSYMYKFMKLVTEGGTYQYTELNEDGTTSERSRTVSPMTNAQREKDEVLPWLVKYINMPRLSISMVEYPTEYSVHEDSQGYISSITYLEPTGDAYVLRYIFEISNTAELRPSNSVYSVKLFTDRNADGKYGELEELDDLVIAETVTGTPVSENELHSGVRYTLTRELPDNFVGMVPWKVQVSLEEDGYTSKASSTGYTAIKASGVTIKVLQVKGTEPNFKDYVLDLTTNQTFTKLVDNIKDKMGYDVRVTTVNTSQFVQEYDRLSNGVRLYASPEDFYNSYMSQYDMLILGFQDSYDDIESDEVIQAVQMYIMSGRSVLFSHDTTSYINAPKNIFEKTVSQSSYTNKVWWYWGYHMNAFVRSLVGMDRYGVTDSALLKSLTSNVQTSSSNYNTIVNTAKENSKDVAYLPDGSISYMTQGFNNYELSAAVGTGAKTFVQGGSYRFNSSDNNNNRTNHITQLNKGQITTYPFNLNAGELAQTRTASGSYMMETHEKIKIAYTHSQYYQLNMDMDNDNDGTPDLVVWYCLAGNLYDAVPNDAVNGYYIYSVGNVTYTGMGHYYNDSSLNSKTAFTLDEAKLFMNTMVASYNSGLKTPTLSVAQDEDNKNSLIQYVYRTYDEDNDMEASSDEKVALFIKDVNNVSAEKKIGYWFYYEVTEDEYLNGISGANKDLYETYEVDGSVIRLRAFSKNEGDEDYYGKLFSINEESVGFVAEGIAANDRPVGVSLKASKLTEMIRTAAENNTSAKVYFGAWTDLTYTQNNNIKKSTDKTFSKLTICERELFDMD